VDASGAVLLAAAAVVAAGVWFVHRHRQQQVRASLDRLVARDPSLTLSSTPCGLSAPELAARLGSLPRGDRRCGLRHGVRGPLTVAVLDGDQPFDASAFEWWWEERRTERTQHGTRTRYVERRTTVALARLPVVVPDVVQLRPESALGRVGLTRGGHQVESSEFNRRFRVECADRALTLHLLDANLQELLVRAFGGRTIEVRGDLLVLTGRPDHRDTSLTGVIGELPAVRQDLARLLAAVPAAFWRAVGAGSR
jgi:hypothetical protein